MRRLRTLTGAAVAASVAVAAASAQGGHGTIYFSGYGKQILVIDEATFTIRDSIPVSIGLPQAQLAQNKKRFYVSEPWGEQIEIIDVASKKSLRVISLSSDTLHVRLTTVGIDPKDRFLLLSTTSWAKKPDHYEINSKPVLLRYDLERNAVTDTIPWPKGEENPFTSAVFSPNGDLIYFQTGDEVLIYDARTLKQVDRWDLAKTFYEEGIGQLPIRFGGRRDGPDFFEEPGFYTSLYNVVDPVNGRAIMGVARLDLVHRSYEFHPIGPSEDVGFTVAPGRKRAFGLHEVDITRAEFWTFDLESHRVIDRHTFKARPRMAFAVGSGGDQVYIHGAGNTIDVWEVGSWKKLRTIELPEDGDIIAVVPPDAPSR